MTEARSIDQTAQAGADALRRQDPGAARALFEQAVAVAPADASAWWGLALACKGLGDDRGQLAALDHVLSADPGHLRALIMKADHFAKAGDGRAAGAFYQAALARAPNADSLAPDLRSELRRAERESARYSQSYESHLRDALAKAGFGSTKSSRRFDRCLDLLLGKKQIFLQSPTSFYFPELPQRQFYERQEFPWLAELESKTETIRNELLGLVHEDEAWRPYVQSNASRPPRDYGALLDNLDWSALYLIRSGEVVAEAAARFPRTMQALSAVPLCESPGWTPAVLFSLLRPGVQIPPHTGYTNARLICHLPLIVPENCGLRVGNEVRQWVDGEALIFDDSIEHEAWNGSDKLRVVLLFDIWRPELSAEERDLVAATLAAVGSYGGAAAAWT